MEPVELFTFISCVSVLCDSHNSTSTDMFLAILLSRYTILTGLLDFSDNINLNIKDLGVQLISSLVDQVL